MKFIDHHNFLSFPSLSILARVRVSPQMSQYQCHCIRGFIFIVAGEPIVSPQMSQSLPSYPPRTQYTTSAPSTNLCAQQSHYCPMYMHANIIYLSNWYLNIALRVLYFKYNPKYALFGQIQLWMKPRCSSIVLHLKVLIMDRATNTLSHIHSSRKSLRKITNKEYVSSFRDFSYEWTGTPRENW